MLTTFEENQPVFQPDEVHFKSQVYEFAQLDSEYTLPLEDFEPLKLKFDC